MLSAGIGYERHNRCAPNRNPPTSQTDCRRTSHFHRARPSAHRCGHALCAQTGSLTCVSGDGDEHYCRAKTENHIQLVRQLSNRGCHPQFTYGVVETNNDSDSSAAASIIGAIIVRAIVFGAIAANAASQDRDDRAAPQRANGWHESRRAYWFKSIDWAKDL
jgi:hypothetical protein